MTKSLAFYGLILFLGTITLNSCGKTSSPEGRMAVKVETLQKDMLDKMETQHQAILDSLGIIRQELDALKQSK